MVLPVVAWQNSGVNSPDGVPCGKGKGVAGIVVK